MSMSLHDEALVDDPRQKWWSSIYVSMFTLFECICGGLSWHEVQVPLGEWHFVFKFMFAAYIWFTYFVVLNVITCVFCSCAQAAAESDPDIIAMGVEMSREKMTKQARSHTSHDATTHHSTQVKQAARKDHCRK